MIERVGYADDTDSRVIPSKAKCFVAAINKDRPTYRSCSIASDRIGEVGEALLGLYLECAEQEQDPLVQDKMLVLAKHTFGDMVTRGKYEPTQAEGPLDEELPTRRGRIDMIAVRQAIIEVVRKKVAVLCDGADAMTVTVRRPSQQPLRLFKVHTIAEAEQGAFMERRDQVLAAFADNERLMTAFDTYAAAKFNFPDEPHPMLQDGQNKRLLALLQLYFRELIRYNIGSKDRACIGNQLVDFLEGEKVADISEVIDVVHEFLHANLRTY